MKRFKRWCRTPLRDASRAAVDTALEDLARADVYHQQAKEVAGRLRVARTRNCLAAAIEYQLSGAPRT